METTDPACTGRILTIAGKPELHHSGRPTCPVHENWDAAPTHRDDLPLPILVQHYGEKYATAYRAVVDSMPGRNAPERHMRGRVAHHFAVLTCRDDITSAGNLTIAACALGYAEQQAAWGAGNARAATAYAAVCSECADPYRPNGPGESFGPSAATV